jgi:hypothetical protein
MVAFNDEQVYAGPVVSLSRYYSLLESYYTGFVPLGRPNALIHLSGQSEAHERLLVSFLDWMSKNRHPEFKPERPVEDEEL